MSLADYANRKYDYLALQNVDTSRETKLGLVLYAEDNSGLICTGIQKLAQRWALEFLTEKGSMPGLPDRGTDFMLRLRQGKLRSQFDVTQSFYATNIRMRVTLKAEEYAGMPDDERFSDADLLSSAILPGYLNMRVMITSVAGDERTVILPIATLPQV
jgi:hypothetical protein